MIHERYSRIEASELGDAATETLEEVDDNRSSGELPFSGLCPDFQYLNGRRFGC
jgi:hypothetical protein